MLSIRDIRNKYYLENNLIVKINVQTGAEQKKTCFMKK